MSYKKRLILPKIITVVGLYSQIPVSLRDNLLGYLSESYPTMHKWNTDEFNSIHFVLRARSSNAILCYASLMRNTTRVHKILITPDKNNTFQEIFDRLVVSIDTYLHYPHYLHFNFPLEVWKEIKRLQGYHFKDESDNESFKILDLYEAQPSEHEIIL